MDFSFIRRNRPAAPDLAALLARTATMQSASPTARLQTRLDASHDGTTDPHIALFAHGLCRSAFANHVASFAQLPREIFSPRQPS